MSPSSTRYRVYPQCCTSAYCGHGSEHCPGCRNAPTLEAFKAWRDAHQAVQADPVWAPLVYVATV